MSVTILPFFKKGLISLIIGLNVDRGVAKITKSAFSTALSKFSSILSTRSLSIALVSVFCVLAYPTILDLVFFFFNPRPIEPPISPSPIIQIVSKLFFILFWKLPQGLN